MPSDIKLGFVGLSAKGNWAKTAHLPALSATGRYKVTGLVNSSIDASKASKEENKLNDAEIYKSVDDMASSENVNTVVVSVRVPQHHDIIKPSLEAQKDVLSEWPLGNGLKEAEALTRLAKQKGVKTGVVLQARKSPTIRKAKELIEAGAIGRIVSSTMVAITSTWGQFFDQSEYLLKKENGANLLTVVGGHNLDVFAYVLGEFDFLHAILKTQFPKVRQANEIKSKDVPDQILVQGVLTSGATASIHIQSQQLTDISREEGLKWVIHGSEGDIILEQVPAVDGGVIYPGQSGFGELNKFSLKMSQLDEHGHSKGIQDLTVDYDPIVGNVKEFYQDFAKRETGRYTPPQLGQTEGFTTFEDAVIRHRELEAILKAFKTGTRQTYNTDTSDL